MYKRQPIDEVAELVKRTAFKITRVGQLVANLASKALGVPAGIILSLIHISVRQARSVYHNPSQNRALSFIDLFVLIQAALLSLIHIWRVCG